MSFQPQQRSYLIHNEHHDKSQREHNEEYIKKKSLVHERPPFKRASMYYSSHFPKNDTIAMLQIIHSSLLQPLICVSIPFKPVASSVVLTCLGSRSEERRVGKECRSRWS